MSFQYSMFVISNIRNIACVCLYVQKLNYKFNYLIKYLNIIFHFLNKCKVLCQFSEINNSQRIKLLEGSQSTGETQKQIFKM